MPWYQVALPAVLIALLVRLEARMAGPYFSFLELLSPREYEGMDRRRRLNAITRRFGIPVVTLFALASIGPEVYQGAWSAALVAGAGGFLLVWPVTVMGLPRGVRRRWSIVIYTAILVGFSGGGALGADMAALVRESGGLIEFIRNNLYPFLMEAFVLAMAAWVYTAATSPSRRHNDDGTQ